MSGFFAPRLRAPSSPKPPAIINRKKLGSGTTVNIAFGPGTGPKGLAITGGNGTGAPSRSCPGIISASNVAAELAIYDLSGSPGTKSDPKDVPRIYFLPATSMTSLV